MAGDPSDQPQGSSGFGRSDSCSMGLIGIREVRRWGQSHPETDSFELLGELIGNEDLLKLAESGYFGL